jgi:hypothetical protein
MTNFNNIDFFNNTDFINTNSFYITLGTGMSLFLAGFIYYKFFRLNGNGNGGDDNISNFDDLSTIKDNVSEISTIMADVDNTSDTITNVVDASTSPITKVVNTSTSPIDNLVDVSTSPITKFVDANTGTDLGHLFNSNFLDRSLEYFMKTKNTPRTPEI